MPVRIRASRFIALLALAWSCCCVDVAQALDADGAPINTSDYAIDLHRGPVLSSTRVTGLAGAFTAIAVGTEGGLANPAAVAVRPPQSVEFWDYWYGLGLTYPFKANDFFNSGNTVGKAPDGSSFFFFNPGGYLQLWDYGFGLNVDISVARTTRTLPDGSRLKSRVQFLVNHIQLGRLFWKGQIAVGGGLQVGRERVLEDGEDDPLLFSGVGFGGELGVLIRPNHARYRIGASLFTEVRARGKRGKFDLVDGDVMIGSWYLPRTAEQPWQGNLGFAYQFGPRPTNPPFEYVRQVSATEVRRLDARVYAVKRQRDERLRALHQQNDMRTNVRASEIERETQAQLEALEAERRALLKETWRRLRKRVREGWSRRYLLVSADLRITGRVDNGVGVESAFAQIVQRSGKSISFSPRIGVEGEVWPRWVKLRGGCYLEPSRFAQTKARVHGTLGFDVRVLHWDVFHIWPEDYLWQISAAFDVTRAYQAFSVSIGGWY